MTRSIACLTVLLLISQGALAQDAQPTYSIRAHYKKGTTFTRLMNMKMDLKGTLTQQGATRPLAMIQSAEEQYDEKILEAQDGTATKISRTYTKSIEHQEMGGQKRSKNKPEHGLTIVWEIKPGRKIHVVSPEQLPEEVKKDLRDPDPNNWLPTKPVAVGHKWKLEGPRVAQAFGIEPGEFKSGTLEGHFVEVLQHKGIKAAKLAISVSIKAAMPKKNMVLTMTIKGHHYIDLNQQLHLEFKTKGKVVMESSRAATAFKMKVEGPMIMHISRKLEK